MGIDIDDEEILIAPLDRLLVRMREDDLRLESMQVETQLRLDRIETRLGRTEQ